MPRQLLSVSILLGGATILGAGTACGQIRSAGSGQDYPNKPIRIVTSEVAGGSDFVARLLAQGLSASVGQQVIVDNRGGGGTIAGEIVAKAPPDGYTLLVGAGTFWLGPLMRKTSYDPVKEFAPITLAVSSPNIIVVHPSLAATSIKELIALAKAKAGQLNYASGPAGSSNHLAAELFKFMAGVDITRITYKGTGPGLIDLLGGQVQVMFPNAAAVSPHMKSGKLRALAVTSAHPSALAPGLPTVTASGLPGYESVSPYGLFATAKTPDAIINRLNKEVVQFLNTPEAKERFLKSGGAESVGSSPQEFAAKIKSEMTNMGKMIKAVGIQDE